MGDGALATSLPWFPDSIHPKRSSGRPGGTSDLPVVSRLPPPPALRPGGVLRRVGEVGTSHRSAEPGDRALLLATPRGEHREARVFIALCLVYTPFGAGCKPA